MANNYQQHQNLLNETTLYLQRKFPSFRFYDRHVGLFYSSRIFHAIKAINSIEGLKQWLFAAKSKYMVKINKPGMCDKYVIAPININGRIVPVHIEMEFKSGSGKLSKDQIEWKRKCENMSVEFIEVRDKEQAEKEINQYIKYIKGN